jgi:hypothetical protein
MFFWPEKNSGVFGFEKPFSERKKKTSEFVDSGSEKETCFTTIFLLDKKLFVL